MYIKAKAERKSSKNMKTPNNPHPQFESIDRCMRKRSIVRNSVSKQKNKKNALSSKLRVVDQETVGY